MTNSHIKDTMDTFSEFEVEQDDLDYWFNVINEEVFEGTCPSPHLMLVKRQRGSWGYVKQAEFGGEHWVALFMSPKFPTLAAFLQILAHVISRPIFGGNKKFLYFTTSRTTTAVIK